MDRWIWVHKKDAAINGQTGFVTCDSKIADRLIKENKAQDPSCGAHHLKDIDLTTEYQTKVMTPKKVEKPAQVKPAEKEQPVKKIVEPVEKVDEE
jgi:hypothetical protein